MEDLITANEAATILHCQPKTLLKNAHAGLVPHYRPMPRKIFFSRSELEKWIKSKKGPSINDLQTKAANHVAINKL